MTRAGAALATGLLALLAGCTAPPPGHGAAGPTPAPTSAPPASGPAAVAALMEQAASGDPHAENDLATRYQTGDGVPLDYDRAFALYQEAVTSGEALIESNLGFMYDRGYGTPQNHALANHWFRLAADQGYPPAMLNLGVNLFGGDGEPADRVEGMKWIDLARRLTVGDPRLREKWRVREIYEHLRLKMTAAEFAEAQRRSADWDRKFRAGAGQPPS